MAYTAATSQSRQVAEATFEFLHMEMVDYVKRTFGLTGQENKNEAKAMHTFVRSAVLSDAKPAC